MIILSRDKNGHFFRADLYTKSHPRRRCPRFALLGATGEAGTTLNAADWDGTLNVGGRFSRNSRMNHLKARPAGIGGVSLPWRRG